MSESEDLKNSVNHFSDENVSCYKALCGKVGDGPMDLNTSKFIHIPLKTALKDEHLPSLGNIKEKSPELQE